jgi:hypothetical protein
MEGTPAPALHPAQVYMTNILSWREPRQTLTVYAALAASLLFLDNINIVRLSLKSASFLLFVAAATEAAGRYALNVRPITHFQPLTPVQINKAAILSGVESAIDAVTLAATEMQSVIFAQDPKVTALVGLGAFVGALLAAVVSAATLGLIALTTVFFAPLVYDKYQDIIDAQVANLKEILDAQSANARLVAGKQTARAAAAGKRYANYLVHAIKKEDFPQVPTTEPSIAAEQQHVPVKQEPVAMLS